MGPIAYTVSADLPDEATLRDYLAWLVPGHIDEVVRGGATRAEVIGPSPGPNPALRVESRYIFPTLAAFQTYETVHAPRLRADGLARFGARGIVLSRTVGVVLGESGAAIERTA